MRSARVTARRISALALTPSCIFLLLLPVAATEYPVSSAAEIARVAREVKPGDSLVFADGFWTDQVIVFEAQGTPEKPITLRAVTPGKVVLSGRSSINVGGAYLLVRGFLLQNGQLTGDGVKVAGHHCRLTDTAVIGGTFKFFVHLFGSENRMDHCYLAGKTSESPTLQIEVQEMPNHHRVDNNHFGPRPPLGRNGGETIRVGYSGQSMRNSATVVEDNLFDRCDGELEIISSKSCENVYRRNTFLECAGMFTLRHGNRCIVDSNFFLGRHKTGSGGIRVIGEDHTIINNYIDGVEKGAFWITAGIPDSPLNGYYCARGCLIAFNTVIDSRGPALDLDAGFGTANRSLHPENITIANNLFALRGDEALLKGTEGDGFKWLGNVANRTTALTDHKRIRVIDFETPRGGDGMWRPAKDSPIRGAAEGDFPTVKTDIEGQPRPGARFDVGCDQLSDAPVVNHPLSAAEVGPSWMGER